MTDTPKRIALRWEPGAAVTSGPLMEHPEYTRWVREDVADAAVAAAVQAERARLAELLQKSANRLDWCAGILPSEKSRDQASEWAEELRKALAAIRAGRA